MKKFSKKMTTVDVDGIEYSICENCLAGDHDHFGGEEDCKYLDEAGKIQCNCNMLNVDLQNALEDLIHVRLKKDPKDDPELDMTPFAHPSYWRGERHGVWGAVMRIRQVLEGKDNGSGIIGDEHLEKLRRDIMELVKKTKENNASSSI